MTSDAEPLSDAWFDDLDRMHKQSGEYGWHAQGVEGAEEAWAEAIDEAYPTIRVRVRELEAERDALMSDLEGPMDARLAALEAERADLRRQVEAARTALVPAIEWIESFNDGTWPIAEPPIRAAYAALTPQTGEVGP